MNFFDPLPPTREAVLLRGMKGHSLIWKSHVASQSLFPLAAKKGQKFTKTCSLQSGTLDPSIPHI